MNFHGRTNYLIRYIMIKVFVISHNQKHAIKTQNHTNSHMIGIIEPSVLSALALAFYRVGTKLEKPFSKFVPAL
jgi:hypothetical protein